MELALNGSVQSFIAVGAGGAIGAMARYGVGLLVKHTLGPDHNAWATLIVNWLGCFAIGLLASLFVNELSGRHRLQLLLITGVLGGFTTFSTFALDALYLYRDHRLLYAMAYIILTNVGGLLLAAVGFRLMQSI